MIFSFSLLQSFFNQKLPQPQELAKLLTLRVFESQVGEKKGKDTQVLVDVLPNRGDCLSHLGLAREISAILQIPSKGFPSFSLREYPEKRKISPKIQVKNKKDCPLYFGKVILGVDVFPSPSWLKEILEILELNSINNVVDITNYVMIYLGQPLHAFDLDKIEGEIVVRRAKKGEKIVTLDEKEYLLDPEILVIADKKGPLAIAGIKGGKRAEITEKTKNVFLEAAFFDKKVIKKTQKKLEFQTESSQRFSAGVDPNLVEPCLNFAAFLISEICGGRVIKEKLSFVGEKFLPKKISFSLSLFESLVGMKIEPSQVKSILKKLGFKAKREKKDTFLVFVPPFRYDIEESEDLVEEVLRIYGLEKIEPKLPFEVLIPPKTNENLFWEEKTKDILKECGFFEVKNYSFLGEEEQKIFEIKNLIKVKNPVSRDFAFLRNSLIPLLLKNVKKQEREFSQMKIFEMGKIFVKEKKEIKEKRFLAGILLGKEKFFEAKGIVSEILEGLGISHYFFDEFLPTSEFPLKNFWDKKVAAEVKVENEEIGFLGKIKEDLLKKLKIQNEVFAFEIDFDLLQKWAIEETEFEEIPKYPAAMRDLSIWVPQNTLSEEVIAKIYDAAPDYLRDVDLFDIYEGEEGRKSFTFRLIFQSPEKTLTSEELNLAMKKIHEELEKNFGWEVRK